MKQFPNYFAGAEYDISDAHYVFFGVPYDRTTYFRKGTRKGPSAIRQASWAFEPYDMETNQQFTDIPVHDYGDIDISNSDKPRTLQKEIHEFTHQLLNKNKLPIAIGGEHSLSIGIIEAFNQIRNNCAVISLDAHLDFRNQFENSKYSHACTMKRIAEFVDPENIVVLGVRSASRQEKKDAEKSGLHYITSSEILKKGMKRAVEETLSLLQQRQIYLSIDMDVFDVAFAPGTSTPEPFGIHPSDILQIISSFSEKIMGCDIVETAPQYDNGQTALLAAAILRSVVFQTWKKQVNP